jgi:outer membrane protein, heavy metal efflux system
MTTRTNMDNGVLVPSQRKSAGSVGAQHVAPHVRKISKLLNRVGARHAVPALLFLLSAFSLHAQGQQMPMPMPQGEHHHDAQSHDHHEHGTMELIVPHYPELGRAQLNAKSPLVTLEQVQSIARQNNPTLRQAEAQIRAAKARQQQAGLYPNPTLGYTGDEIRGGSVGGGKEGFFVEQTIVTGGKLRLSRELFGKQAQLATIEADEQRIRVESAVQMAFVRVLAAQEMLDARRDLAKISQDDVDTQRRLFNTGQTDEPELLDAEVIAERARMAARMQENTLREEWRSLSSVIGQPELPMSTVGGDLGSGWPELNEDAAVEAITNQSPAVKIAETGAAHAQSRLARSLKEPVPDITVRAGMEYNNELLDRLPFAKGWEGIAEVSLPIPIWNRNQGDTAAAISTAPNRKNAASR